jgi:hypothetical protein
MRVVVILERDLKNFVVLKFNLIVVTASSLELNFYDSVLRVYADELISG